MEQYIDLIWKLVAMHWTGAVAAAFIYTFTHVFKKIAPPASTNKFWSIIWRLLPLHAVILGFIIGLVPWTPVPAGVNVGPFTRLFYYMGAGIFACWGHDIFRTVIKLQYKVDIDKLDEETTNKSE